MATTNPPGSPTPGTVLAYVSGAVHAGLSEAASDAVIQRELVPMMEAEIARQGR